MAKTSIFPPSTSNQTLKPPAIGKLLTWYGKHARALSWREHQGRAESPYHTWISEIMLQQTTVATVIPYYMRFITRWPTVKALAAAHEDDVLKEWAGLGYYSRARNLHQCAKQIVADYKGVFPDTIEELKKLPGIGEYTANAIRAIAFDKPANVVDGNVERVMARVFAFSAPLNEPKNKKQIKELAASLAPQKNAGAYAQALMDLGATICTPQNPKCGLCPWNKNCQAFANGNPGAFPVIQRKKDIPTRHAVAFLLKDKKGRIYLRRRPATGLLANLWEVPSTMWRLDKRWTDKEIAALPFFKSLKATHAPHTVTHVFSHFKLITHVYVSKQSAQATALDPNGRWFAADALPAIATLTAKMIKAAASE